MADDEQSRNLPTEALGTANTESRAEGSDDDEQAGLSRRRRPRQQQQREPAAPSMIREVSMSEPSSPTTLTPGPENGRSSSTSPVRRFAGAVAEAVSTALRKAVTSPCCIKSADEASVEEASPKSESSPEALLKTSPEKPCLRRRSPSPNPDAIVPNLKVSFTGVPEEPVVPSCDEPDCRWSCEDQHDEQPRQAHALPSSSQSMQDSTVDTNTLRVLVEVHPLPPQTLPQPGTSARRETEEEPDKEDAPQEIKKDPTEPKGQ